MLIRFIVSNFFSIGDECEFNMLPAPLKSHPEHIYYNSSKRIKVLKGAAIYGANGAGKSNLIKAIHFVQAAVRAGEILPNMSRFKYKLDPEIASKPTVFDVEYEWHKKFYGYHIEIQNDIITEESLYELGFQKEDKMLFERKYNAQTGKIMVSIGGRNLLNSRNKLLASLLADNILTDTKVLLTNHNMFNNTKISNAFGWFVDGLQVMFPNTVYPGIAKPLSDSEQFTSFANSIITTLDTGVSQIGIDIIPFDKFFKEEDAQYKQQVIAKLNTTKGDVPVPLRNGSVLVASVENNEYVIKRPITYHKDSKNNNIVFDIKEESDGTQRLLDIIPAIDMYLNKGTTVIVDEVDESLHPSLLKAIIAKIMACKPIDGGQFIVSTHESNLLDYEIYRQDEIWFVEKNNGSTELYPLTDFKPRADLQLQKGYLMGRFGAVPFLANLKTLNWM